MVRVVMTAVGVTATGHDSNSDDAARMSHNSESGLWLPEEDSRNTPATMKLK